MWVLKWEYNGYKTVKWKEAENAALFQDLHGRMRELNQSKVKVLFWQVPRYMNKNADKLANEAFYDG